MLHVFDTFEAAQTRHTTLNRLNRGPFSIFQFFGNGKPQWAFWSTI